MAGSDEGDDVSGRGWAALDPGGTPGGHIYFQPSTGHDGSMLPPRLSAVTLGARDMRALRSFYLDLGWRELPGGSDAWSGFLLGGVLLTLYPLAALAAEAVAEPPPEGWSGVTLTVNVDSAGTVDEAFASAVAAGARAVAEPEDRSWGGRSGYIADPEGNRWEIAWAPGLAFDERGAVLRFGPGE
jgi:catechol 2,3-dioxygenase-like lactoylglutathione lyase family enzyme